MINFIKIAKELYAQVKISNRDIFYSQYKLILRDNPEDLIKFPITQDNLNRYLPFLKEEEIYYLHAIAHKLNIGNNQVKDEILEHNKQYGTNFTLNNFKEIYSKNLNLLMNYIDSLKSKDSTIIYIDKSAVAIYYLLNLSLFNVLLYKGKVNEELINNLPENKIIKVINLIKKYIKESEINYNNNQNIINKIKQDIIPELKLIKFYFDKLYVKKKYSIIEDIIGNLTRLLEHLFKLDPYNSKYVIIDYLKNILNDLKDFEKDYLGTIPITFEKIDINYAKNIINNLIHLINDDFEYCNNFNSFIIYIMNDQNFFEYSWGQHLDSDIEKELESIYKRSGERLLVSDSNEYVRLIISDFIKKDQ